MAAPIVNKYKCGLTRAARAAVCQRSAAGHECADALCPHITVSGFTTVQHSRPYVYECPRCKRIAAPIDAHGHELNGLTCGVCKPRQVMTLTEFPAKIPFTFSVRAF